MINSSLISKQAHVCIVKTIAESLRVSWDSSSFSSDCFDRVPKHHREEGIEVSILYCFMQFIFLSPWTLFRKSQRWRCAELNLKPHITILRQSNGWRVCDRSFTDIVLGFYGEKKVAIKRVFLSAPTYFQNSQLMEACLCGFYGGWIFELQWGPLMVMFHHGDAAEDKGEEVRGGAIH